MPEVGELRRACEIDGVPASYGRRMMIWQPCEACAAGRWVETRDGRALTRWCFPCGRREGKKRGSQAREKHPRWKGGRHITSLGYVQVTPERDHPLRAMIDSRGRVYEHRWVVACALGRVLLSAEEVHHRNGDKHDNRLENLEIISKKDHQARHAREVAVLRERVQELERELAKAQAA